MHDVLDAVAASATGRRHTVLAIEALILHALVQNRLGDSDSAIVSLARAIELAEPEGIVQPFRDENDELEPVLRRALAGGGNRTFSRALLCISNAGDGASVAGDGAYSGLGTGNQLLVEPLSPRELEVLRNVRDGHTNQMIADTLFISLSTVKKHLNNLFGRIFEKLGVHRRTEAVLEGRRRGFLNENST